MIVWSRMTALGAAILVLAAACGPGVESGATDDDLPPAPPVRELRPTEPIVPDDGLHRIVVTLPRSVPSSPDTEPASARADDGVERGFAVTVEMLAGLPDGVSLSAENGILGYRNGDGELVVLGPVSTRSNTADLDSMPENGTAASDMEASDVAERLASLPGVESVSAITDTSYAVTATSLDVFDSLGVVVAGDGFFALSGDPYEPYQWPLDNRGDNLDQLSLPSAPDQAVDADVDGVEARTGATGAGVVVAVVDSGVDFDHPDLAGAAWVNPGEDCEGEAGNGLDDDGNGFIDDCTGWDFGNDDPIGFDGSNDVHGTHVAGIIAAAAGNDIGIAGLAPDAELMDLRVDSADGVIRASAIARAIRYAADNGADIVNLSLGSQPGASPDTVVEVAEAAEYAAKKGVLLVAAAGNNAVSLDDSPVYPASLDTENMIVVAASTPDDGSAWFSNTGSPVDVFAPGELVLSTVPGDGLAFHSGTSQAAPLVAAAAALVLERQPELAPGDVAGLLTSSGEGNDSLSAAVAGANRLNAAAAIGIGAVDDLAAGSVTIAGLADDDDGVVAATISLGVDGGQFNQPFHWEASLITIIKGAPHAVTGHPVSTGDIEAQQGQPQADGVLTDGRGAVHLADRDASSAAWSTTLPDGLYALVIEAVPRTDSTVRLGNAFVATFTVGEDSDDDGSGEDGSGDESGTGDGSDKPSTEGGADGDEAISSDDSVTEDGSGDGEGTTIGGEDAKPDPAGDNPDTGDDGPDPDIGGPSSGEAAGGEDPGDDESGEGEPDAGASDDDTAGDDVRSDAGSDNDEADADDRAPGDDAPAEQSDDDDQSATDTNDDTGDDTIELGPDRAEDGEWKVTDIEPRTGWVDTENLVQVVGTFPRSVEVWFDDNPGYVEFESEELLVVRTGRHELPGPVDVTVVSRSGEPALTLPHAYAFLSHDDDSIVSIDVGGGDPTPGLPGDEPAPGADPVGEEPDFGLGPGDGISVGDPPTVGDSSGSARRGSDDQRSRNRQARAELIGDPFLLENGLTVVAVDGLSVIGGVPACNEDPCRTRRV